jgi:DNA-binding PadR family transcriptional regulator
MKTQNTLGKCRNGSPLTLSIKHPVIAQYTPVYEIRSKILKAVLDTAILKEMSHVGIASAPAIIELFAKKYSIYVSAGTIYPTFKRIESMGFIEKIPRSGTRLYTITNTGNTKLKNIQQNIEMLEAFLVSIICENSGGKEN